MKKQRPWQIATQTALVLEDTATAAHKQHGVDNIPRTTVPDHRVTGTFSHA